MKTSTATVARPAAPTTRSAEQKMGSTAAAEITALAARITCFASCGRPEQLRYSTEARINCDIGAVERGFRRGRRWYSYTLSSVQRIELKNLYVLALMARTESGKLYSRGMWSEGETLDSHNESIMQRRGC